jgi:AraC-like DNA-binding protein
VDDIVVHETPTVWRHAALRVCAALRQLGKNPQPLLSRLHINVDDLLRPGFRLSSVSLSQLLAEGSQLLDREDFALYAGAEVEPLGNSALRWAVALSPTPAQGIQRLVNLFPLITDGALASFESRGKEHALTISSSFSSDAHKMDSFQEDMLLSSTLTAVEALLPDGCQHTRMEFTQRKPDDPSPWYEFFGEEIKWAAPQSKIWWETSVLCTPKLDSNEELALAHEYLAMQQLAAVTSQTWAQRVEWQITATILDGSVTQTAVAAHLGIEIRTLQRHLKAEGVSFQELLATVRKRRALNQLSCNRPIAQIGYELGYTDPSAFCNAFKKWFGVSPGNYFKVAKTS